MIAHRTYIYVVAVQQYERHLHACRCKLEVKNYIYLGQIGYGSDVFSLLMTELARVSCCRSAVFHHRIASQKISPKFPES